MKRRSKAGGIAGKAGRPNTATSRPSSSSKAVPNRRSIATTEQTQIARLTRDLAEARKQLTEALEQQTAASDILRIISQSPTDVRPVFDGIVVTAAHLLRSDHVAMMLRDGDTFSAVAAATPKGPVADARLLSKNMRIDPSTNFPSRGVRPLGRTVSCGGFDSLPGVVILELCRAQIAERGV